MEINQHNSIFQVCVDRAVRGAIVGRVFTQRLTAPMAFENMGNLLLDLERLMDLQGFPQSYQRIRTFQNTPPVFGTPLLPAGAMPQAEVAAAKGKITTFQLHIITRQNATWQGGLRWEDGEAVDFASDLELLALVDSKLFE